MLQPKIKSLLARLGACLLVPVFSSVIAHSARADGRLVGVPGTTSGSQTFIRVRPSALTPPVAKVPAHTRVYVWGRFGDWYRVETKDHVFGWVHKEYIAAPHLRKVKTISHFKAKVASDKSANHTLYGTPAELKAYYARYGGKGAVKGLALKGVYVAPKSHPVVRLAKTHVIKPVHLVRAPHHAPSRTLHVRVAQAPHHATSMAPHVRVAMNPPVQVETPTPVASTVAPSPSGTLLPPPTPEELGVNRRNAEDLSVVPNAMTPDASGLADRVRHWTPAKPQAVPAPTHLASPPVQAPANTVTPEPRVAPVAVEEGTQLDPVLPRTNVEMTPSRPVVSSQPTPEQLHTIAWQARLRAKQQRWKWAQARRANEWKWRQAQAQKHAAAAYQRRLWLAKQRNNRYRWRIASRQGRRNILIRQTGMAPKVLPPGVSIKPASPDEIMRAREQYLKNQAAQAANQGSGSSFPSGA